MHWQEPDPSPKALALILLERSSKFNRALFVLTDCALCQPVPHFCFCKRNSSNTIWVLCVVNGIKTRLNISWIFYKFVASLVVFLRCRFECFKEPGAASSHRLKVPRWCIFTLRSTTAAYPSRVDVGSLCCVSGLFVEGAGASKRRDDDNDVDGEALSPEPWLLLYTNMKLVTMVTTMMPLTPWHWRDTWNNKMIMKQHQDRGTAALGRIIG